MRAPCAPASSGGGHAGVQFRDGDLEVVAQRGVAGGEHRPDRARVRRCRAAADDLEHAGVLGDHVAGAAQQHVAVVGAVVQRGQRGDVGDVAQRPHAQAPRPPARTRGAGRRSRRRVARASSRCRRRAAPARPPSRSSGTCSLLRSRVSRNRACPAVHSSDADWSRIPVGAPTKSFSAARATSTRSAAEFRGGEVAQRQRHRARQRRRRRQPHAGRHVAVDEHAHAAGHALPRAPARRPPGSRPSRRAPGRQVGQGQFDAAVGCCARRGDQPAVVRRATAARVVCASATGSTKPPL